MTRFLLVCLGGAVGTGARYLLSLGALRAFGAAFPWGTWFVNVAGSSVAGFLVELATGRAALSPTLQATLVTGVLGGFTTYSTFNAETLRFVQAGEPWLAAANLLGTVVACLVAGLLGIGFARWLAGA